jgi:hypothetical protein
MRRYALCVAFFIGAAVCEASAQKKGAEDVSAVVDRVADYVRSYFARAQSIVSDETVLVQALASDLLSDGPPRVLRNELRVSWEPDGDGAMAPPQILRTLISVNGRPPKEKDRDKCFDPKATSPEVLSLFLPENKPDLTFTSGGRGKVNGRAALILEIRQREAAGPVTTTETSEGCYAISAPGRAWWKAWIDEATAAVLRLDEHSSGMYDVTLPPDPKKRLPPLNVIVERIDSSTVYRPVTFKDPDELVMLPVSRDYIQVMRNSPSPRIRITQNYRNYRRFMTAGRIVD